MVVGVMVVNVLIFNIVLVVEFMVGYILSLVCCILVVYVLLLVGVWKCSLFIGVELFEKIVGIVGFGWIGVFVVVCLVVFDMCVVVYDFYVIFVCV